MVKDIDLSVIIVSYNTRSLLDKCLSTLIHDAVNFSINIEIIVVDNASADGTENMIRERYPKVHLLINRKNLGFGQANNTGIKIAQGRKILLLNSDTQTLPGSLQALLIYLNKYPKSIVGGKLFNPDGSKQTSSGPRMNVFNVFLMLFMKGDKLGLTRYSPNSDRKVGWVSGACLSADSEVFRDGLFFDENIFMYMEEIDLCKRAENKGYSIRFCPEAKFIHVGAASSDRTRKFPIINIYKGLIFYFKKHHISSFTFIKLLLKAKAIAAILVGQVRGDRGLINTYEEAIRFVK